VGLAAPGSTIVRGGAHVATFTALRRATANVLMGLGVQRAFLALGAGEALGAPDWSTAVDIHERARFTGVAVWAMKLAVIAAHGGAAVSVARSRSIANEPFGAGKAQRAGLRLAVAVFTTDLVRGARGAGAATHARLL
jgi:hypothetical protein